MTVAVAGGGGVNALGGGTYVFIALALAIPHILRFGLPGPIAKKCSKRMAIL
jgi:hypothetical protein